MKKRLDSLFSALMLAAAVAVILAGGWRLSHSIARARDKYAPLPAAVVHLGAPDPDPAPESTTEILLYVYDPAIPLSMETCAYEKECALDKGCYQWKCWFKAYWRCLRKKVARCT